MRVLLLWGQCRLDEEIIKRGVGRGGFGEVYFAVSDGGKEVALKLLARGRRRRAARHRPLPEPQAPQPRPPLRPPHRRPAATTGSSWSTSPASRSHAVLNRHPNGLPLELVRSGSWPWPRRSATCTTTASSTATSSRPTSSSRTGTLKVGDYGLSQVDQRQPARAQTQSVGTVHYMAPEISTGNYSKQIDVYACGVILYEMLTGQVPFHGDSSARCPQAPDGHPGPRPGAAGVPDDHRQGASKKPAHRYAGMAEMAREVEPVSRITVPVRKEEPLFVAKVIDAPAEAKTTAVPPPLPNTHPPPLPRNGSSALLAAVPGVRERLSELATSLAVAPGRRGGRGGLGPVPVDLLLEGGLVRADPDVRPDRAVELGRPGAE